MNRTLATNPESAQLSCPKCHAFITYYDVAGSEYYACPSCHAYFRWSEEETPKVLGNYKETPTAALPLPIGAQGRLAGHDFRVVGVVERRDAYDPRFRWREYQLFRAETGGYVQLAEFDGHWTLIWEASQLEADGKEYKLVDFKLFNKYQLRVSWALGEFDWDIEKDDSLNVTEYINPPYMLVQEQRGRQKKQWYRSRHVPPAELATGFGLHSGTLPRQAGVGALEPAPGSQSWSALRTLTGLAIALLLVMQLVLWQRGGAQLLHQTLEVAADTAAGASPGTGRVLVSPSFTLDHQAALEVTLQATLNNQWLELPVSLVNEQTGQGFEFTKNIEFYSGTEGGESWSEGSREADAVLSRVPAGRYHLNLYPITEPGAAPVVQVTVRADPALLSNFLVALGLILLLPALHWLRRYRHELRRWANNDFSPYNHE